MGKRRNEGFWSGLYGLVRRLTEGVIICIIIYVLLTNLSFTGTYTFNADKGINLLLKNFSWIVKNFPWKQ